ncbi:MAG: phosphonate C-P lyase system protein PhnG [Gammaproteobacteria bacterium]|nr:phosphonate C-P lyase system protein PhnG [Gammaproteobacteria bacterium]MCP5425042.1 phosphonate C-P lyase system protein PhnG [Gammaproteobacteria bacterium]MCP5459745.1 phosphonate C-P lyase system protein PhnG [Gammaproteobacteria bacterium]
MGLLAKSSVADLEAAWQGLSEPPSYDFLRAPETGLAQVRARAGGTGLRFNLGEMTMTRCVVRLRDGTSGYAYVAGRNRRHAELAAALDALLQDPAHRDHLQATVLQPLVEKLQVLRQRRAAKVAATQVDFFTLARGE